LLFIFYFGEIHPLLDFRGICVIIPMSLAGRQGKKEMWLHAWKQNESQRKMQTDWEWGAWVKHSLWFGNVLLGLYEGHQAAN